MHTAARDSLYTVVLYTMGWCSVAATVCVNDIGTHSLAAAATKEAEGLLRKGNALAECYVACSLH